MKRYLLSYLAAYVASLAAFGVIMVIAISNWFFTDSPLWFDVLGVIVTALPALALGEVLGRRFKAKQAGRPLRGLLILLAIMAILAFKTELHEYLYIASWPGLLIGNALQTVFDVSNHWDGAFVLLGNLLLPLLFHLGWRWGTAE